MKNKSGSKSIMDSVEILRVIKKLKELLRQEGVSPPPYPTPLRYSWKGFNWGIQRKISEILRSYHIPTGAPKRWGGLRERN